jgi:hypothetical protein
MFRKKKDNLIILQSSCKLTSMTLMNQSLQKFSGFLLFIMELCLKPQKSNNFMFKIICWQRLWCFTLYVILPRIRDISIQAYQILTVSIISLPQVLTWNEGDWWRISHSGVLWDKIRLNSIKQSILIIFHHLMFDLIIILNSNSVNK